MSTAFYVLRILRVSLTTQPIRLRFPRYRPRAIRNGERAYASPQRPSASPLIRCPPPPRTPLSPCPLCPPNCPPNCPHNCPPNCPPNGCLH
eukprot:9494650-Pyramimonas_sp.AAC.2